MKYDMFIKVLGTSLLLWLSLVSCTKTGNPCQLNEYISHYEPLRYELQPIRDALSRTKRDVQLQAINVHFQAHGHHFHLKLKRDLSSLSDTLQIEGSKGDLLNVDTSNIFQGELLGDRNSAVFGSIRDGIFEGKIVSRHGRYSVENAKFYLPSDHNDTSFHSVIYKDRDVVDPYEHLRESHSCGCGINHKTIQWMKEMQSSPLENYLVKDEFPQKRQKRSRRINRNICSLYIQTDPILWRHIRKGFPDNHNPTNKKEIDKNTREEIVFLIAHHVAAVNYIYGNTKFDGKYEHRNIRFEVQRIKIDDDSVCDPHNTHGELHQFCSESINVTNYLDLHSRGNYEDYCLAYLFTYRDFAGGVLGLTWPASAEGASGGICEKYKTYTETVDGSYQSTKESHNAGVMTFVNYKSRVPPIVSQLMFAHLIGHNFGSPHDPEECQPGGPVGNYIMFASATAGDKPNNSKFSPCSVENISNVLDAISDNRKRNCFTASKGSFCGNKIVELGEECDCGYDVDECTDKCCCPRMIGDIDRMKNESAQGCRRRYGTQCSPSQGPCCESETCTFVPENRRIICRPDSECALSSMCNGISSECPLSKPLPDKTRCNNGTQLCTAGECVGSVCMEWNLNQCFLTANVDKRTMCMLACQSGADATTCTSSREFAQEVGLPPGGISLSPGSPCNDFRGYCDEFLECRDIGEDVILDDNAKTTSPKPDESMSPNIVEQGIKNNNVTMINFNFFMSFNFNFTISQ